ncbi:hypothetical protein SLEP1_g49605 [Rubroshorea leprosula]|uniref:Photosystem II protein I n=1 Tax=Rubroshorea leprosula TaxID=152421 RepID=A0AAV5LZM2_9ROSI|nr:hypothetical protein SLEP1_g49605 [Rubroshorea leprosula]
MNGNQRLFCLFYVFIAENEKIVFLGCVWSGFDLTRFS